MKKGFSLILIVTLIIGVMCSCGNTASLNVPSYKLPNKLSLAKTGVIAQNQEFSLEWNYENKYLVLTDLKTNNVWSTVPSDLIGENNSVSTYPLIKISYIEPKKSIEKETDSARMLSNGGYISAKRIKNGLQLTFYFDNIDISIPVQFILEDNGLSVNVYPKGVTEGKNKLYSVSVSPFFASAKNNSNSCIFVPSGCGAIMNVDDTDRQVRSYSEPIYGSDETLQDVFKNKETENVRLPVFGVKNNDKGILAIVEDGAECASIEAQAGEATVGYSYAYAKFYLRGYADAFVKDVDGNNSKVQKFTDSVVSLNKMSVKYLPLKNGSDYNSMAISYRNYLKDKGFKSSDSNLQIAFDIYGGSLIRRLFLGIPYYSLQTSSTLKQAKNIVEEIHNETDANLLINLKGFGNSGLDYGKICGGFKIDKVFGNKDDFNNLNKYCKNNGIELSLDLDCIYFNKSSSGYSKNFDVAKTANTIPVKKYDYSIVTHEKNTTRKYAYLVKRQTLADNMTNSLNSMIEKYGINSITLSTLGNTAYSDYSDAKYYNKANMAKDVSKIIKKLSKSASVVTDNANLYSAIASKCIVNAPTMSSLYNTLDEEIPFYQMIFHGSIPCTSSAINLSIDSQNEYLKAISTGSPLYFAVCNDFNDKYIVGRNDALSVSVFKDIKSTVYQYIKNSSEYLNSVSNSKIKSYYKEDDVSCTEFENGTVVYVNFGKVPKVTELGTLDAGNFIFGKKGE